MLTYTNFFNKFKLTTKYLIRLDGACNTLDYEKRCMVEKFLDKYGMKPIVAVIPNNQTMLCISATSIKIFGVLSNHGKIKAGQ